MSNKSEIPITTLITRRGESFIPYDEAKDIAVQMFISHFGVGALSRETPYVNAEGNLCQNEYYRGDVDVQVLRKATEMDKMAQTVIREFTAKA